MTRVGGPSTVAGISFQALAIARAMVSVYQGNLISVRAEVPPHADFGQAGIIPVCVDDYVIQRDAIRIYHQAKTNAPGGATWTITKLCQEDILQKFIKQLEDDLTSECCLVTSSNCQLLGDVAERARNANGFEEFIANLTIGHQNMITEACQRLGIDKAKLYWFLVRCRLEIRSSEQFKQDLQALSSALFADSRTAIYCLFALAMEAMETGQLLDQKSIKIRFAENSVFSKPKMTEAELLSTVREASSRLRTVGKDIGGVHIPQLTVDKLLEWVNKYDSTNASISVLLDQAGSGKTVAMSMLLNRLEESGFVVLGIKVDGLAFSSQAELASIVGLPDSIPSVLQSLCAIGHRIALLIDQVDALSSTMSRNSSCISSVLDLVARVAGLHIPIVLACRSFDWKYDSHLRHLRDKHPLEYTLPEFTDDQLTQILSICAIKLSDLRPSTINIIRCPLRLKVFFDVVQTKRQTEPSWIPGNTIYSLQTLYQEFWELKINKAVSDNISGSECEIIANILAQRMRKAELLSVPEAIVAKYRITRDWLISEGVLFLHNKVLAFFHQTFFDFILARLFVSKNRSLVKHLLESDQGLFYRPMVRQVLEYMREATPSGYISELKSIIENNEIRKHLRRVAVLWLGNIREPKQEELTLLEPMLANENSRHQILSCLLGNPAWFDLLTPQRFDRWLQTFSDIECSPVLKYLKSLFPKRQNEIVMLLSPHISKSESWNNQISSCLAELGNQWDDCSIALFFEVLRSPMTDLTAPFGWWAVALDSLAKSNPSQACQAIRIILDRFITHWTPKNFSDSNNFISNPKKTNSRLPTAHNFIETLSLLGNATPESFLKQTLSWTLSAIENSCASHTDLTFKANWREWSYLDSNSNLPSERLLSATGSALINMAKYNTIFLRTLISKLMNIQCLPIQIILAEAYIANPQEFASEAAAFLLSDSRRLRLGGRRSVGHFSADLIKACHSYWSKEDFRKVEFAILTMKDNPVKSVDDLCWAGRTHLELLRNLDRKRLSANGHDLLGQLERKFPLSIATLPKQNESGRVGSPIRQSSIKKMNDKCWLKAMRKYTSDGMNTNKPLEVSGGRIQLSGMLQVIAKEQPERFYSLAMNKLDKAYHLDYVLAIIMGISEAGLPAECVGHIIFKFLPQIEHDNIHMAAWALEKYAGKDIPQPLLDLLKHWVEHAACPVTQNDLTNTIETNQVNLNNFVTEGMNSDCGAALRTLAIILLKSDPPCRNEYLNVAETVLANPSNAVRAVCIDFLKYAIPADPIRACDLFRQLVGQNHALLREQESYDFIYFVLHKHTNEVMWAIERMLEDEKSPKTKEAGAKLACLAAFNSSEASKLRDICIKGDIPMRKGAAAVYSANISEPLVGKDCQKILPLFLNDEDVEVRKEATAFLRDLNSSCIQELADFLRAWTNTKSLFEGAENAAYMLEQYPNAEPKLTINIAEHLIDSFKEEIVNIQSSHALISYSLTPAILNVYQHSTDAIIRRKAIDLFEKLEELGCSEVYSVMESADRI